MYLTDAGRHALLTGGLGSTATHLSVHTGSPISAGGNEATGGAPAYARKAITWAAASSGKRVSSVAISFDVPTGEYLWFGLWTAVSAGTFLGAMTAGGKPLRSVSLAITDPNVAVFTQTGHGFSNGATVVMFDVLAAGLPTGFTEGTLYYIVSATTDTFQLAATAGGAAITSTTTTEVFLQEVVKVAMSAQGVIDIAAGDLILDGTLL